MLNKKNTFLIILTLLTFFSYSENFKVCEIKKTEEFGIIIEKEIFGNYDFERSFRICRIEKGVSFDEYFYNIQGDNLCLGIASYNRVQDNAVLYINTAKEFGSKCIVYLSEPKEKQIFYLWEPTSEPIDNSKKEKISIKTNQCTYNIMVCKEVKELELNIGGMPKLLSVEGLEQFPNLTKVNYVGFNFK